MSNPLDDSRLADEVPFLADEPPPFAARGLAWLLIGMFLVTALLAAAVRLPETVSSPFVLAPERGIDPVRAPRSGTVTWALAEEGGLTSKGATLFRIRSPEFGDRASELKTLEAQLTGVETSLANAHRKHESESLAAEEELKRLLDRSGYLDRMVGLKREQLELTSQQAARTQELKEQGLVSVNERADALIRQDQTGMELEQLLTESREARNGVAKLRHEQDALRSGFQELVRSLKEKTQTARIRTGALSPELGAEGSELTVSSPCVGTLLRLAVRGPGAVVGEGEVLADVACTGEQLHAELTVPQGGLAMVKPGLPVKLLYDAFPYQRYGVKEGAVVWASPASVPVNGVPSFRVFVALRDQSVSVSGEARPLLPGMAGIARIVVGRRSLISYAFGPLRQLRESFR